MTFTMAVLEAMGSFVGRAFLLDRIARERSQKMFKLGFAASREDLAAFELYWLEIPMNKQDKAKNRLRKRATEERQLASVNERREGDYLRMAERRVKILIGEVVGLVVG